VATHANQKSLTALIDNQDWENVMQRIERHPRSIRHRHFIELNGVSTRAHPLHHALSQLPPVSSSLRRTEKVFGKQTNKIDINAFNRRSWR
jgi:hypothetical protein